ncbi:MAG: alanine racemase [Marinibacterium sp.]|nr:alanine racemase [Marinibacterium sp.]
MTGYAERLIRAVSDAGLHRPVLVLDAARLRANLDLLARTLPRDATLRLADKSLPAPDLLALGFEALACDQVMSFHLPLTAQVLARFPKAQALMGKPMPVRAAAQMLGDAPLAQRITWLIDSAETLAAYRRLADDTSAPLSIAFEVNIGLGRGGFETPQDLASALGAVGPLTVRGLMGYEAHVHALPRLLGRGAPALRRAMARLAGFVDVLPRTQRQILNTGGSSTILDLPADGPANDLTLGSLLVKPSDFDQPQNAAIQPALFIVTPVIKTCRHGLPGHPGLSRLLRRAGIIRNRIAFAYGGKWMAQPIHPQGLSASPFFSPSSNQHGICLPNGAPAPDHIVFRPTQSEAVLQQFAALHVFDGAQISGQMTPFAPG